MDQPAGPGEQARPGHHGPAMLTVIGFWFALAGGLAVLAGLSGRRRARRLRAGESAVWALTIARPLPGGPPGDSSPPRLLLQYTLADGHVMEHIVPGRARKAGRLRPGEKVLIWYDPQDPDDILVYGHEGRTADLAFIVTGLLLILAGGGMALGQ
jgi:Protein of unknown function (DUF3592)/Mu transposase, C-terminal